MWNPIVYLKTFLRAKELEKVFEKKYAEVQDLGRNQEYKLAIDRAYRVFEILTDEALERTRPINMTAREYVTMICDEFNIDPDIYQALYLNFELARYSREEITFEHYSETLDAFEVILKEIRAAGEKHIVTRKKPKGKAKAKARKGKARGKRPKRKRR